MSKIGELAKKLLAFIVKRNISTLLYPCQVPLKSEKADDEHVVKSGTSFSTPMVSGLTGLPC
ncbi:MAG: hypothetical protein QMC90_02190 [Dehalococcoidales bacterium]|nr:hypothetical protein [Dehalococcoidales bacterium]